MARVQRGEKWKWPHGAPGGGLSHPLLDPWWLPTNSCCKTQIHHIIPTQSPVVKPWHSGSPAFPIHEIPSSPAISTPLWSKVIFRQEHEGPWSLNKIKAWQLISLAEVNIVEVWWCTAGGPARGPRLRQATASCIFSPSRQWAISGGSARLPAVTGLWRSASGPVASLPSLRDGNDAV